MRKEANGTRRRGEKKAEKTSKTGWRKRLGGAGRRKRSQKIEESLRAAQDVEIGNGCVAEGGRVYT